MGCEISSRSVAEEEARSGAKLLGEQKMMDDRWLSVDEIAVYLGVKRDTVYKWVVRKKMPAHKAGRLWKFKTAEVDAWLRSGKAGQVNHGETAK